MGTLIFLEDQKLKDSEKRSKKDKICWIVCLVSTAKTFFRKVEWQRGKDIDGHFTVLMVFFRNFIPSFVTETIFCLVGQICCLFAYWHGWDRLPRGRYWDEQWTAESQPTHLCGSVKAHVCYSAGRINCWADSGKHWRAKMNLFPMHYLARSG